MYGVVDDIGRKAEAEPRGRMVENPLLAWAKSSRVYACEQNGRFLGL